MATDTLSASEKTAAPKIVRGNPSQLKNATWITSRRMKKFGHATSDTKASKVLMQKPSLRKITFTTAKATANLVIISRLP